MGIARIVGTAAGCDLRIAEAPYLSSRHFSITRDARGEVFVEDLGSTNGTEVLTASGWVKAWSPVPIGAGSKIYAGRVLFTIDEVGHVTVQRNVGILDRDSA